MSVSISSLSSSNAKEMLRVGLEAIERGQYEFDLGKVVTTDSSSIAVMLAWQRAAKRSLKHLQFLNTPPSILSLAALYGVGTLLGLPDQTAH
jgi:phospholipid transport system transporter-binding protein